MGLLGIMFGIGFFIVTQAQTEGFQNHFKQTILGTNGSIRISERIQEIPQTLAMESGEFKIKLREGTKFSSGIEYPSILRQQLENFSNIAAIS